MALPNLSLYTVYAVYFFAGLPSALTFRMAKKHIDNVHPRGFLDRVNADPSIDKKTKARILRLKLAEGNAWETIALYTAIIILANIVGVPTSTLNFFSISYTICRGLFVFVYEYADTQALSYLRTVVHHTGTILWIVLLWKSAGRLEERRREWGFE